MRSWLWAIVLLLVSAVAGVSVIPQPDLPETAFNEVDLPVNQAVPVVLGIKLIRPVAAAVPLHSHVRAWQGIFSSHSSDHEWAHPVVQRELHSSQTFLCTFLI